MIKSFALKAAALLVSPTFSASLNGVGYQNKEAQSGVNLMSMAGGAPIVVYGLDMSETAAANAILLEPWWLEGAEIIAPESSVDDQFNSNSQNGRLAYTVPSVAELMNADFELFNGEALPNGMTQSGDEGLNFHMKVYNGETGETLSCGWWRNCWWRYHRDYTAQIWDITPPNVAEGTEVFFHTFNKHAHHTSITAADADPFLSLKLGSFHLDTSDTITEQDFRLSGWSHDTFSAVVTDGPAEDDVEPHILYANGYGMIMPDARKHCSFDGEDCWTVRVHPRIKGISQADGWTTGGQELTIAGWGFNGTDVSVEIDGVACEVTSAKREAITCVTGATQSESSTGYQPGQQGLTQIQLTEDESEEWAKLSPTYDVLDLNSSQPILGWFVPPATGEYRFYVACNTWCNLYMDLENPYIEGETGPFEEQPSGDRIAYRPWWGYWRQYYYQTDDGHISDWISLEEGKQYWMHGQARSQMSVAVEVKNYSGDIVTEESTQEESTESTETTETTETTESTESTESTETTETTETSESTETTETTESTTDESTRRRRRLVRRKKIGKRRLTEETTESTDDTTTESTETDDSTTTESTETTESSGDSTESADTTDDSTTTESTETTESSEDSTESTETTDDSTESTDDSTTTEDSTDESTVDSTDDSTTDDSTETCVEGDSDCEVTEVECDETDPDTDCEVVEVECDETDTDADCEVVEDEEEEVVEVPYHPMNSKTLIQVSMIQTNVAEEWYLIVANPDSGSYKLNFVNPRTTPMSYVTTSSIDANTDANTFRKRVDEFYSTVWGGACSVERVMYDSDSVETTDSSLATSYRYNVKLLKQIDQISTTSITATKADTSSSISITPPSQHIQSSTPISGYFNMKCYDPYTMQSYTSKDMKYNRQEKWLQYDMGNSMAPLIDRMELISDYRCSYRENCISFLMHFHNIDYDMPECEIIPSETHDEPLTGADDLHSETTVIQHYGDSLFFPTIPMSMLRTNAQAPQVKIVVDGRIALCNDLNCDYVYSNSESLITGQSLTDATLTLTGENLPTDEDLVVNLGPITCTVMSATDTELICTLDNTAVGGSWIAIVHSSKGLLPNEITDAIEISFSVTEATPATDVNFLGGDVMTINGDGFGFDASAVTVVYADGTACSVTAVDMTAITCTNQRFTSDGDTTQAITVTVNGVELVTEVTVDLKTTLESTLGCSPSSVSPVLKTEVDIFLDSSYTATLVKEDFSATLYSFDDADLAKPLYVMSVDDTEKSVKVKFPGAPSGEYWIQLSSEQTGGALESDLLLLSVHSTVTAISPLEGSIYGGTLVTITGENFSDEPLDNPVKIGDNYCYVITTSPTEITCRTDLIQESTGDQLIIVFLKTSEEASTPDNADILFKYVNPTAEVTDVYVAFDEVSMTHQIVVTGTGFDDTIHMYIDDFEQTFVSTDGSEAIFTLTDLHGVASSDIRIYTSQGYPEGAEITHNIESSPSILSINPAVGSSGGTILTATGTGFGITTDIQLLADGTALCEEVQMIEYGEFTCKTYAIEVAEGAAITVSVAGVEDALSFIAEDVAYSQVEMITVTAAEIEGNRMTVTGTGFIDGGIASFGGIEADQVLTISSVQVIGIWDTTGIGAASDEAPELYFVHEDGYTLYASIDSAVELSKTLEVTESTTDLECSFAGGCTYAIGGEGLYATLLNSENNWVDVCGLPCHVREDLSDYQYAICEVPELATTYSIDNYQIVESKTLYGTVFPEDTVLYDDLTQVSYEPSGDECSFGMTMLEGHVGVLDEAKIFINFLSSKTPYVNNLFFQGSNDEWETYDDLHTFSEEIHEGWNYLNYREHGIDKPAYNSYRFYGTAAGACRISEFRLHGVQAIASEASSYECTPTIYIGEDALTADLAPITYSSAKTPVINSISPRFGSVLGGTTVTLTGENLLGTSTTSVYFDDRECAVEFSDATSIICITSDKPYVPGAPTAHVDIDGLGYAATRGLVYRYVSLWSSYETWGGDIPPLEGESINVPSGQHLLVDVDSTPVLNAVIVEGSLIFPPDDNDSEHMRTFDANFLFILHGYFEVGTEEFPYTSKIVITMHGTRASAQLSIYGAKMIGCRFCDLHMNGIPREVIWSRLAETAEIGATSITLEVEPDWKVGEIFVIAGSNFNNVEDESRVITAVDGATLHFDEPFLFMHLGEAPEFDGVEMPMRTEVGLQSRNVIFRGDPVEQTRDELFGAHIMVHSPGDETSMARIQYIEFTEAGQAFNLGRYAIHFHMIGTVHSSMIRGNAIHHSYNRAVTTHGVHYFKVYENFAYDTMGHSFFIEDAVETNCVYDGNLAIKTKASNSFLNTDQTPGGFWITNANNILINNAIAGTDAYGYWYDMQETSLGPSFDPNVCPEYEKLGEFRNNTAHSVRKYGLRIFHALIPRTYPCASSPYDSEYESKGESDPYWQNPKVTAIFEDYVGWRCGFNGAITERTGNVIFRNFKIADNGIAGVEFAIIEDVVDGYARLEDSMIIGNTGVNDADDSIKSASVHGVIGPKTDLFTIDTVAFHNFDFQESAALGTCSHCFHPSSSDMGARTYSVNNLSFNNVPKKIKYQFPFKEIIYDIDGSLTGLGSNSWAAAYYPHLLQPECQLQTDEFDGVICTGDVQIRSLIFYDYAPDAMRMQYFKIARWDDDIKAEITADNSTLFDFEQDVNHEYFTRLMQREQGEPSMNWAIPVVTGHTYRFHWGESIDFDNIKIQMSPYLNQDDLNTYLTTNFTAERASINITDQAGEQIMNETLTDKRWDYQQNGDNVIYNQSDVREFQFVINGDELDNRKTLTIEAFACVVNCEEEAIEEVEISEDQILWSSADSWESGSVPVEGEEVEILPGVNMVFDLESSPILDKLTINGRLSFLNDSDTSHNQVLNTKLMYIRTGELFIGTPELPYNGNAEIRLHGAPEDTHLTFSLGIEAGNKVLTVVGLAHLYGEKRDRMSRLHATVLKGDNNAFVEAGLDWRSGDQVALMPTATQATHFDYMTIESYDAETGEIIFTEEIYYYHWGKATSTAGDYNGVDMRGEVVLLTRNVKIVGEDTDGWGGQILVADNLEMDGTYRTGELIMDNVEVYNCSQQNTYKSAIRFEQAITKPQLITGSVIWGGLGWLFSSQYSAHIHMDTSAFISGYQMGIAVWSSQNITMDELVIGDTKRRLDKESDSLLDKECCVSICAWFGEDSSCSDISITNSISAGCVYAGFVVPGNDCDSQETQTKFRDNVAHSISGDGAFIFPDVTGNDHSTCYEGSHFSAYKCTQTGLFAHYKTQETRWSHVNMIDNTLGISMMIAGEESRQLQVITDSHIYGETEAEDCPKNHNSCWCPNKMGYMSMFGVQGARDFHVTTTSPYPLHNVHSYGSWASDTLIRDTTFHRFEAETTCGGRQRVFELNPFASDFVPPQNFQGCTFDNVEDDAVAYIFDPPEKWNNLDDCISFPCTAPSNILLDFKDTKFEGEVKPDLRESNFQIISDTAGISETFDDCETKDMWNAWICENDYLGLLVFNADDEDWEDRGVTPVYVSSEQTGYTNKLNSHMDHTWDGFYTGQKHKQQFQPLIYTNDVDYTIEYSSTPFDKMRYELRSTRGQIKVKVQYPNSGSFQVKVDGKVIDPTDWDKAAGRHKELTGNRGCGENRFVGIENYLEFILTPWCRIDISPLDSIPSNVRMDWTMDEFYDSGGVTSFMDRVSAALGIHASQVKVVAVYTGSVVVEYQITVDEATTDATAAATELRALSSSLTKLVTQDDGAVFGAPILSASTGDEVLIEDPTYNPVAAATNQKGILTTHIEKPEEEAKVQETTIITIEEEKVQEVTRNSLIGILGVMVLVFLCCAGITTVLLCVCGTTTTASSAVEIRKRVAEDQNRKVKAKINNVSDSNVDVDEQYVLPEEIDLDIFAMKKRQLKVNQEDIQEEGMEASGMRPQAIPVPQLVEIAGESAANHSSRASDAPMTLENSTKKLVGAHDTIQPAEDDRN